MPRRKKNETRIICPNCGSAITTDRNHVCGFSVGVSRDGDHHLVPRMSKAEERLSQLKANGVDTSNYFQVTNPQGQGVLMKWENGIPVAVSDEVKADPILGSIMENGYVKNTATHRRFVMAQMFRMLNYDSSKEPYSIIKGKGYTDYLNQKYDYMYQFKMMKDEIHVLAKLQQVDPSGTFAERVHFFSPQNISKICDEYVETLKKYVASKRTCKCKGIPYKHVNSTYGNVFVSDLDKKIYQPLSRIALHITYLRDYRMIEQLYNEFYKKMIKLPRDTKKEKTWVDCFKGSGAYYTIVNMLRYHNCVLFEEESGLLYTQEQTEYVLKTKLDEYENQGWRWFGMMKKLIEDNHFDFDNKMRKLGVYK